MVFVWEEGCGQRNDIFRRLTKGPVIAINELGVREIKIAEGVAISTPSVTHLVGLPHQGCPLLYSDPSTLALFLRTKPTSIGVEGRSRNRMVCANEQKITYSREKSGQ